MCDKLEKALEYACERLEFDEWYSSEDNEHIIKADAWKTMALFNAGMR